MPARGAGDDGHPGSVQARSGVARRRTAGAGAAPTCLVRSRRPLTATPEEVVGPGVEQVAGRHPAEAPVGSPRTPLARPASHAAGSERRPSVRPAAAGHRPPAAPCRRRRPGRSGEQQRRLRYGRRGRPPSGVGRRLPGPDPRVLRRQALDGPPAAARRCPRGRTRRRRRRRRRPTGPARSATARGLLPDGQRAGEAGVLAARPVRQPPAPPARRAGGRPAGVGQGNGHVGVGRQRQVGPVLLRRTRPGRRAEIAWPPGPPRPATAGAGQIGHAVAAADGVGQQAAPAPSDPGPGDGTAPAGHAVPAGRSPWPLTHSGSGPSSGRPVKNLAAMHPPWQAS